MPTLPALPYSDNGKKISITRFGGINRRAGDGGMYDGLNMSGDNYPYLATRMGFSRIPLKNADNEDYTPDFAVKASVPLSDGSGIVYVGTTKAAIHTFATGKVSEISYGETLNVEPQSIVSFVRTRTVDIPAKTGVNVDKYDYTFYITLIMSAKYAIVRAIRVTTYIESANLEPHPDEETYCTKMGAAITRQSLSYYTDYSLSTWFGVSNNEHAVATHDAPVPETAPDPEVNLSYPPVYINKATESVLSTVSDDITALVVPGLYYTMRKQVGADDTTSAGLALDVIKNKGLSLYYSGDTWPDDQIKLNGAVFLDDDADNPVGFKGNTKVIIPEDNNYYAPPAGIYTIAWGDAPDGIRGAFISGNRLWAYDEHTIYASAPGQFEIFTVDEAADAGGWSVPLPDERDIITGGISYNGRPVFFTEGRIITVYGGYPSAFSLRIDDGYGVEYKSSASLKLCGNALYYLSKAGVMRYAGNTPVCISSDLTRVQLTDGRAATDSRYYMLYARQLKTRTDEPAGMMYVYDTFKGEWHEWQYTGTSGVNAHISAHNEQITDPTFCYAQYEADDVSCIVMTVGGTNTFTVWAIPTFERQALPKNAITREANAGAAYYGYNDSYFWGARFGPFYMSTPKIKELCAVQLRARLISQPRVDGATLRVKLCYDDADAALNGRYIEDGTGFTEIYSVTEPQNAAVAGDIYAERNIYIPLTPRRCVSFKVEISGTERWEISDMSFEYKISSDVK